MDKRKVLHGVIGVAAFIVGGIMAREKAIEAAETVEDFFSPKEEPNNALSDSVD